MYQNVYCRIKNTAVCSKILSHENCSFSLSFVFLNYFIILKTIMFLKFSNLYFFFFSGELLISFEECLKKSKQISIIFIFRLQSVKMFVVFIREPSIHGFWFDNRCSLIMPLDLTQKSFEIQNFHDVTIEFLLKLISQLNITQK